MTLNIVAHKKIYLAVAFLFVGAAVASAAIFGFRQGADFSGGTLWQFTIKDSALSAGELENFFEEEFGFTEARVNHDPENDVFFARFPEVSESDHRLFSEKILEAHPSFAELGFQSIGPSVGAELRRNAVWAIVLVLIGISLYTAFAFRHASYPVSSWKYGLTTIFTLFHDVAIPAGLLAILGHFGRVEIDTNFVVALLVVMGFSVHDTIVVFDRIRENLAASRGKKEFGDVINESVSQTLARSINTSLTLIFVLLALYFFGPPNLQFFVLTLLVGVAAGTYSSIFLASPALTLFLPKNRR